MIQKIIYLVILFSTISFSQNTIFTQLYFDDDNEGLNTFKYYLGYGRDIQSNLHFDVMGGYRHYITPDLKDSYKDFRIGSNYKLLENKLLLKGNISFLFSDGWNPIFYDIISSYSPTDLLYIEAYIEHESVGLALTNEMEYTSTFTGASVDINAIDDLTFVIGQSYNYITDGNSRWYQTYRTIYTLPLQWIFIDAKAKIATGGTYSPYYFSPESFEEYNIGIGLGQELFSPKYFMKFYIGGGIQSIDGDIKGLFMSNIRLSADFIPELSSVLTYGISNAVNTAYGAYLYNYGTFKIIYYF